MATRSVVALLCLVSTGLVGCRVESPPTRREKAQIARSERAQTTSPHNQPLPPASDDAERVLDACGRPAADTVEAIYDKLYNGPVRRMVYRGRQVVLLEYIPSLPLAQQSDIPAPFPPGYRASPYPPPNAVWRFQAARVDRQEFLTSRRFEIYLPCAAHALAPEL